MRKNRLIFEAVIAGCLILVVVLFHVRTLGYKDWTYHCAICGRSWTKGVKTFFGVGYQRINYRSSSSETTKLYDELIGLPHEHEWVFRSRTISRNSILGGGRTQHGDRHPLRLLLMREALRAINDEFKDRPPEFRQDLYFRLISCASWEEFYDLLKKERGKPESENEATDL